MMVGGRDSDRQQMEILFSESVNLTDSANIIMLLMQCICVHAGKKRYVSETAKDPLYGSR